MAVPIGISLTLHIDSATIGALFKPIVSERRRVRAGRAWLNWCRGDLVLKKEFIQLQHVASHQEKKSVQSKGNDKADAIANAFREKGEHSDSYPYFTIAEERIIFKHNENNIQGDIREVLKSFEKEKLMENWATKTKVQSQWIKKYPTQIFKNATSGKWQFFVETVEPGCISSLQCVDGSQQTITYIGSSQNAKKKPCVVCL